MFFLKKKKKIPELNNTNKSINPLEITHQKTTTTTTTTQQQQHQQQQQQFKTTITINI